jgi:hypothetical protein
MGMKAMSDRIIPPKSKKAKTVQRSQSRSKRERFEALALASQLKPGEATHDFVGHLVELRRRG